jgi:hypothetical protein
MKAYSRHWHMRIKKAVIPAKAGIHFDLVFLDAEQHGFPLSRE